MDPHGRSATIEVMARDEAVLGAGRYGSDHDGLTAMLDYARQRPGRVWAVEGSNGIGDECGLNTADLKVGHGRGSRTPFRGRLTR
jgi:hypothetical protein